MFTQIKADDYGEFINAGDFEMAEENKENVKSKINRNRSYQDEDIIGTIF